MRKTLLAITLGLTALAVAACGDTGASSSPDNSFLPGASVESVTPIESAMPSDMLESPSDMLESPAAS